MILIIDAILLLTVIYLWFTLEKKWMTVYVGFDPTNPNWNYFCCDGVADNIQVQAAIDAMPRFGGLVNLVIGGYEVEETIEITKKNITLKGVSKND